MLTNDLNNDLKLLAGIAFPFITAYPFSFLVRISACFVIILSSLCAFSVDSQGTFHRITLTIWGDKAIALAELSFSFSTF